MVAVLGIEQHSCGEGSVDWGTRYCGDRMRRIGADVGNFAPTGRRQRNDLRKGTSARCALLASNRIVDPRFAYRPDKFRIARFPCPVGEDGPQVVSYL